MIPPIDFLWEQMNGPQVTAIEQALYNFLHEQMDQLLDYLLHISIDTASDQQLSDIGKMMNLPRPVIRQYSENYLVFTDGLEHPTDKGFGDLEDPSIKGAIFADLYNTQVNYEVVDIRQFRAFLKAAALSAADAGSLVFLDDVLAEMAAVYGRKPEEFNWSFEYQEADPNQDLATGDIVLNMGLMSFWGGTTAAYAFMEAIALRIYPLSPRLRPKMSISTLNGDTEDKEVLNGT